MKHRLSFIIHHSTLLFSFGTVRKRVLFVLFALFAIGQYGFAYDFSAAAPSGQTLYYSYEYGVNGSSVYVTFPVNSYPNYYDGYVKPTGALTIPSSVRNGGRDYTVTSIGDKAFWGCSGLTSVTIPNSVTSIKHSAFYDCTGLTSVTIPNSVTSMDDRVFYNCSGLTSVTIPNSMTRISSESFYGCTGLTSVTIPNSVTGIGPEAFYGCSGLTSVTIPNTVTIIEDYAFYSCRDLASVAIPSSVTAISGYAFYEVRHIEYHGTATGEPWGAYSMNGVTVGDFVYADAGGTTLLAYIGNSAEVTIPSTVTSIYEGAFSGCSGLTSVSIGNSVTSIGDYAFQYCSGLTSVTIGNSVTRIGNYAFKDCSGLTSVTIGNSVTSIGRDVFSGCSGLTSIAVESSNTHYDSRNNCNAIIITNNNFLLLGCQNTIIPNSVTTIGGSSFQDCSGLTSVTIPNSVTRIGGSAFSGCTGLTSIECQATVPPTINDNTFEDVPTNIPVYVPCVSLANYQSATYWSNFTNIQARGPYPYTVTASTADNTMGTAAVTTAPSCTTSTATLTATPECGYQFVRWSNGSTDNPYTLTITQDTAITAVFEEAEKIALSCPSGQTLYYKINCANHTAIVVPENDGYPFYNTFPTGDLSIPSSITVDGHTYPVTSIGQSAFEGCYDLTSVTIPSSVTTIGIFAFEATRLQSITIPNSVTNIEHNAFRDCTRLTSITIPASVTHIDGNAFVYCSNLTSITVDAGNTVYDSRNGCNAIIETATNKLITGCNPTTIPNTVATIGSYAFAMFKDIPAIFIPNSVTSIEEQAFYCCFRITDIVVDAGNTAYDSRDNCNAIIETSSNTLIFGCINTVIPNTVTSIGSNAFSSCSGLTSITIPGSVTCIGYEAFRGRNLTEIISLATAPPTLSYLVFYTTNGVPDAHVYVPCGSLADYQAAEGWSDFTNIQERYPYTLTANTADNTMGTADVTTEPTCSDNSAIITATPNCGYRFVRWTDAAGTTVSNDNPCTLSVTQDTTLTAVFEEAETTHVALTCPSGQTLYYLLDCANSTATVVPENNSYYSTHPTGDLTIPSCITYGSTTYSVTSIGDYAFRYSDGLTSVTIPNSVTSIGYEAFGYCYSLTSFTIPSSVTFIDYHVLWSCNGLTSISVESGNTVYDSRDNCNAIIETSSNTLLAGCMNTVIPNSVTSIGVDAFYNCSGLTSITIPSSVTSFGSNAFCGCTGLASITVESGNPVYDSREDCNAIIETSTNTLLASCINPVIPSSVTAIGDYAFFGYNVLTSIILPEGVTSIGNHAFCGCSGLTTITIPSRVTSIDYSAFSSCTGLTSIECLATVPPTLREWAFSNVPTDIPVYVPCGTLAAYQAADGWSSFTNFIEGNVFPYTLSVTSADNTMGSSAVIVEPTCANYSATITATPDSCYRFVRWEDAAGDTVSTDNPFTLAVSSDTALTAVFETSLFAATCPSGQTLFYKIIDPVNHYVELTYPNECMVDKNTIDQWDRHLSDLLWGNTPQPTGTLVLPDSVSYNGISYTVRAIGSYTFSCCGITSLVMSNTIDSIASNAFHNCSNLSNVTYSNTLRYIGENALRGCRLGNVVLPASLKILGVAALTSSNISSITLNDSLEVLSNWSLAVNPFTSLYIPASVRELHTACWYMDNLSTIVVDADNPYYDSRNNCNAILNTMGEVLQACNATVLPEGTTRLYGDAFRGCRYSTFVVPNTVTDMAFHECHIGRLVLSSPTVKLSTTMITVDTIQFLTDTPPVSINNYDGNFLTTPILVPCNSLAAYQASPVWGQFTNIQEQAPYTLSVTSADNTMGTAAVTTEPTCSNNTATITATANSSYHFDHWSNVSTDNPCSIALVGDSTVTAFFAPNRYYVVTRTDNAQQGYARSSAATQNIDYANLSLNDFTQMTSSTSAPAGDNYFRAVLTTSITNGSDHYCYYQFEDVTGDLIWEFTPRCTGYWSLTYGIPNVNAVHCGSSMFTNTTIGDVVTDPNLAGLTVTYTNLGWLLEFPVAVHCVDRQTNAAYSTVYWRSADAEGNSDTAYYDYLSEITVTAYPNTGYQFYRWSDGNTDNPRTVTVVSDTTFVAEFATETQSWDQATACPGWNNPNSFITGGVDVNIYSGQGVNISSNNKPCPNPVTGVTGVSEMTTMYSASQLASVTTGECSNALPNNGNQFLIISDTLGYDPNTGNNLRYVPVHLSTQIKKSIRIGDGCSNGSSNNSNSGAQLNYTMRVTPDNAVMIVYYAIVAQAPGHGQQGDPTVVIRATKKNNAGNWQQISDTLAYYISATPINNTSGNCPNLEHATLVANGQTGWHTTGAGYSSVNYKDWARVSIDLSNFLYDTIQLQFLSYDCLYNAHYGYAYIAGECRPAGYILPQDTIIHINMAVVGDSLFTQEDLSMVVAHQDATYIKLSFNVEPTAERIEVLDHNDNLVATFYDSTEEHVFRLTTGLYTLRAVFPSGDIFEGTIDFTNELQE